MDKYTKDIIDRARKMSKSHKRNVYVIHTSDGWELYYSGDEWMAQLSPNQNWDYVIEYAGD